MKHLTNQRRRRRGSLYLVVLGVSMIVSVCALTAMSVGRAELFAATSDYEARDARLLARSAIEHGINWLNNNDDWRSLLNNDSERIGINLAGGSFTWKVVDPDGDLDDDPRDWVQLVGIGRAGAATAYQRVTLEPAGRGLSCLEAGVYAKNNITMQGSGSVIDGDGLVAAGATISSANGDVRLPCEATVVTGLGYSSTTADDIPPRETPGENVFDYYLSLGSEIAIGSFPLVSGSRRLQYLTLSREINSHGEVNPHGIYWVDCGNAKVNLGNARVRGTLVLLNVGADSIIGNHVLFQAEAENHPTLMVDGGLTIDMGSFLSGDYLSEAILFNFNPPGMPYEGVTDYDTSDSYPAKLEGLVYISGTAWITDETEIDGVLVAGDVDVASGEDLEIDYTPYSLNYPPPGFSAGDQMRVVPGTWERFGE